MKNLVAVISLVIAGSALGAVRSYVVVVGNNQSVDPATRPLRFADDDAARYFELFRPVAKRIELLTVMDAETQGIFKGLPAVAQAPTKANLLRVLEEVNADMARDTAAGDEPVLYLVYVGHGHIGATGGGFVSFLDGPLTGAELGGIVARSRAAYNHLIFDACNSYLLVAQRGGGDDDSGPDLRDAIRSYLDEQTLVNHPNTGLIFSTRDARETHEWSVFRGGVFSQEVRSALAGAADVNADGRIEYSELDAFLSAANLAVDDPRARLEAFIHAPSLDRGRPVMDLAEGGFEHFLRLPQKFSGRFHIEDHRGVRYLDGNKTTEAAVFIALVGAPFYFVRNQDTEARVALRARGTIDVGALQFTEPGRAARGSVAEAFRDQLFKVPYGPGFYRGFVGRTSGRAVSPADRPFPPRAFETLSEGPLRNPYE